MSIDYKQSGVDVEAGDALVSWLQKTAPKKYPNSDRVVAGIGGFASLFRADFPEMKKPCLVSGTDGVGTKLKLAMTLKKYDTVGQDLVAMCVNDILTVGAKPLFFLDYYATGKLDLGQAQSFLTGLRAACLEAEIALVGGETAEMPGFYHPGDFDVAGFAVGIVDQEKALGPHRVQNGDAVLGISSSGFHSNGYSLVRKLFEKDYDTWGEKLLTPTCLYTKLTQALMARVEVHAFAHITGGGMENIPRVMKPDQGLKLKKWKFPSVFEEAQERSQLQAEEMLKTFNCGVGWVVILPTKEVSAAQAIANSLGYQTYDLGMIEPGHGEIDYREYWA